MNERMEFADDLMAAGVDFLDLANALHEREAAGDCWFGVLGYLVIQLAELVAGRDAAINLLPNEMTVAVRAFTNISRTFKILKGTKNSLIPPQEWKKIVPFGEMMNTVWNQIPGQENVRKNLPDIVNPKHPAWRKETKNGRADT